MNSPTKTSKEQLLQLFEGIFLGRTLHDLEKQAGTSIEDLLRAVRDDEDAFQDFKAHREWATYVQESELTTKLRENAENPTSPIKTNALKLYADHLHWAMERANPGHFGGKLDITSMVPLKIVTTLDLGGTKNIEGVYDLTATTTNALAPDEISDSTFKLLETSAREAPPSSPFHAAVAAADDEARIAEAAERLERAFDAARGQSLLDGAGEEEEVPQTLEKNTSRSKPRRERAVVRRQQRLVEQGTREESP